MDLPPEHLLHAGIMDATAPPTIYEKIAIRSVEHDKLQQALVETEYISSALQESSARITALSSELTRRKPDVLTLDSLLWEQQTTSHTYRESAVRRFAYNVSGKKADFAEKMALEEHLHLRTVQRHEDAKRAFTELETKLAEAKETHAELEAAKKRRESAQQALDDFYAHIFDGPSPEFDEEDREELALAEASYELKRVQKEFENEMQALELLGEASAILGNISKAMAEAEIATGLSQGTGNTINQKARISLIAAKKAGEQLEKLLQQAKTISSAVGDMGPMKIPTGDHRGSFLQYKVYREAGFLSVIKLSRKEVRTEVQRLRSDVGNSRSRVRNLEERVKTARQGLKDGKMRLQQVRRDTFNAVMSDLPEYY